jgi:CubicO group peptidase (beta-lactamase class C family)
MMPTVAVARWLRTPRGWPAGVIGRRVLPPCCVVACAALLAGAGCAGGAPEGSSLAPEARGPAATPADTFALTRDIPVVIAPVRTADEGWSAGWTLRIADGDAHPVRRRGEDAGYVPALDVELRWVGSGSGRRLEIGRYGETVLLDRVQDAPPGSQRDGELVDLLEDLTPRLMIALNVPGVSIALIRDREIRWLGQFGVSESGSQERVDASTVFEAASMSKPAYAYSVMTLVERGGIDLDVPLVEYLGRDCIEADTLHRRITARMVLSHATGFPNWRRGGPLEVRFPPGTEIGYSGEGFQYLQTAVEEVTGRPTEAFARETLLGPLGMTSSSFEWQDTYEETYAAGHSADGTPRPRRSYEQANTAYTLYTTAEEYARYLVEVMQPAGAGPHSLGEESLAAMLAPQHRAADRTPVARGGKADGDVYFALGWRLDRTPAGDRYYHSGSNSTGFQCYAEFDPRSGHGIVVMTNSSSGSRLWRALIDAVGGE